jgi:hypothetical protein
MEDEDPTGFIAKNQALPRMKRTAEQIAEDVNGILSGDPSTSEKLKLAKEANRATLDVDDDVPF